jgi:hypothetical protein
MIFKGITKSLLIKAGGALLACILLVYFYNWRTGQLLEQDYMLDTNKLASAAQDLPSPVAELPPVDLSRPLRLAVGDLGLPEAVNGQVCDLVTVQLAQQPRFELVERRELNRVLDELQLGHGRLARAADAIKAGKLVRADWYLLGSPAPQGNTNAILVRLVDARSSVLRNAGIFTTRSNTVHLATELVSFLNQSTLSGTSVSSRAYITVGNFLNYGMNDRHPDFPAKLKSYLAARFLDSNYFFVEREHVDELLEEIRLDLAGLTTGERSPLPPMQSAYWLVDGYFQALEENGAEIDLVLQVDRVLSDQQKISLRGPPDETLFRRAKEAIDTAMQTKPKPRFYFNEFDGEARAQFERGVELSKKSRMGLSHPGGDRWYSTSIGTHSPGQIRQRMLEAIRAFQSALLLKPKERKTMLYLADCYHDSIINRVEDGRNYYREIIADSNPDEWTHIAHMALADSYRHENLAKASQMLKDYVATTKDPKILAEIQDWFRFNDPASMAAEPSGEDRVLEILNKAEAGLKKTGYTPVVYFSPLHSQSGTNATRSIAELLPSYMDRFPDLIPFLTAKALVEQTNTNTKVLQVFLDSFAVSRHQTNRALNTPFYWQGYLQPVYYWAFNHKLYSLMEDLYSFHKQQNILPKDAQVDKDANIDLIALAYALVAQEKWREALNVFESFGDKFIVVDQLFPGYYYGGNEPFTPSHAAEECRLKLGLPPIVVHHSHLDQALLTTPYPCILAFYDQVPLLASGNTLMTLDENGRITRKIPLPKTSDTYISALCISSNRVWIGTDGEGLIEVEVPSGKIRLWTVKDGLFMDYIASLFPQQNSLWIGYGQRYPSGESMGGLGKLDITNHQLSNLIPALPKETAEGILSHDGVVHDDPREGPPRHAVTGINATSNGDLWISVVRKGIQSYQPSKKTWKTYSTDFSWSYSSITANAQWLVAGSLDSGLAWRSINNTNWLTLSITQGLPENSVQAVALDGDYIWLGGRGYLSVVDARNAKVLHTSLFKMKGYFFKLQEFTSLHLLNGNAWFTTTTNVYRVPKSY